MKYEVTTAGNHKYIRVGEEHKDVRLSLVFYHGLIATAETWKYQLDYFRNKYQVWVPANTYEERLNLESTCSSQKKLFETEIIPNSPHGTVVIGNSMGAITALEMAHHYPDNIKGYGLIHGAGQGDNIGLDNSNESNSVALRKILSLIKEKNTKDLKKIIVELNLISERNAFQNLLQKMGVGKGKIEFLINELYNLFGINDENSNSRLVDAKFIKMKPLMEDVKGFKFDTNFLKEITQKGFGIYSPKDTITPWEKGMSYSESLPNFSLHKINSGHAGMVEKPRKVNRIIEDFLRELK